MENRELNSSSTKFCKILCSFWRETYRLFREGGGGGEGGREGGREGGTKFINLVPHLCREHSGEVYLGNHLLVKERGPLGILDFNLLEEMPHPCAVLRLRQGTLPG